MINSMTAFGRSKALIDGMDITVEIKSVNNKFLDCSVKVPRSYSFLEDKLKAYIRDAGIKRGKVEVYVGINMIENKSVKLNIDKAYAESYINALKALRDEFSLSDDISVMTVAQNRDVFTSLAEEEDADEIFRRISVPLEEAVKIFLEARKTEGANLAADMKLKKERLEELADMISGRAENAVQSYHDRLYAKLKTVLEGLDKEVDEARILTECAIVANKIAIDEELVRLHSHFKAFDELLEADGEIGRKMDFLIQEINREINTTGSKCNDIEITRMVVEMKNVLEKIREQVQNIE